MNNVYQALADALFLTTLKKNKESQKVYKILKIFLKHNVNIHTALKILAEIEDNWNDINEDGGSQHG